MKLLYFAAALLLPTAPLSQLRAETRQDAEDRSKIIRTPLLEQDLREAKLVRGVRAARIDFVPGQRSGRHRHPVPTMGVVLEGEILFQIEGESPRVIGRGEAFFEPANTTVTHFDNASTSEPASFAGFYLLSGGETAIIGPAPEPVVGSVDAR